MAIATRSSTVQQVLGWIITLLIPFAVVLTAVRVMLTPAYVRVEYATPGFPEDSYGFTLEDRLHWSGVSLDYLLNDAGIEFLADEVLEEGGPLYNERELGHMFDVKNVVNVVLRVWIVALLALAALGVWAWQGDWASSYGQGLVRGGWATIIFVAVCLVFVIVGFGVFFVFFHEVFFDPGTWTFQYSDTLIRLFPERFWRDTFLWVGLISFGQLGVLMAWGRRLAA
jgi:integral membrane protein (TIGR01906 family)